MIIKYNPKLIPLARKMRKNPTRGESMLWNQLRKNKYFKNFHFTQQKPIGEFIVDFYSAKLKLVIEVDGATHNYKISEDNIRQNYIESLSLRVVRFMDSDVKNNLNGVIIYLENWIKENKL